MKFVMRPIYHIQALEQTLSDLIETIYVLAQPADLQWEIMGPPFPGEEMMVDFFSEFSEMKANYLHYQTFTQHQWVALEEIEKQLIHLRQRPDVKEICLNPKQLTQEPAWQSIRCEASTAFKALGLHLNDFKPEIQIEKHSEAFIHRWRLKPNDLNDV